MATADHLAKYRSLVEDIREGMLVTHDPSLPGLRSRPMSTSKVDEEGALWFFTQMTSAKVQEIYHDRDVNVAYQKPSDNQYVSASGKAQLVNDDSLKEQLYSPLLDAWFDGPQDPQASLLRVDVQEVEYWDDTDSKILSFAKIAAAAVTGGNYSGAENEKVSL